MRSKGIYKLDQRIRFPFIDNLLMSSLEHISAYTVKAEEVDSSLFLVQRLPVSVIKKITNKRYKNDS